MRPIDRAKAIWQEKYKTSFVDIVACHLACVGGLLFSTDDCFVLGRAIKIQNPSRWLGCNETPDAFCITLAVGDLPALGHTPISLDKICFYRRNDKTLRIFPTQKFLQKCKQSKDKKWMNQMHQIQGI